MDALVEYIRIDAADGSMWIDIQVDRVRQYRMGPFASLGERQRCLDDMLSMMRSVGAQDLPLKAQ